MMGRALVLLAASAAPVVIVPVLGQNVLSAVSRYDDLRAANAATVTRVGTVDAIPWPAGEGEGGEGEELGFCHLAAVMPFSINPPSGRSPYPYGFETAASALLAVQHLNDGDGSVIAEVGGLNRRCPVRFTAEMFDTELSQKRAVELTMSVLDREHPRINGTAEDRRPPCAFLGNTRSAVSLSTSVITGLRGYPQFSPISLTAQLDDKVQHPFFGRLTTSSDGIALPIIEWYKMRGIKHLGVLHNNDGYGNSFARAIVRAAGEYAPDMSIVAIDMPVEATQEDYAKAVGFLKSTQYRYFFGAFAIPNYDGLMEEAYQQGMAGDGRHNWMFSVSLASIMQDEYVRGSALHRSTRGIAFINIMGGGEGMPVKDRFSEAFRSLNNPDDVAYLVSQLPQYPGEDEYKPGMQVYNDAFFDSAGGTVGPFVYDSTIALGLAACNATARNIAELGESKFFDGPVLYRATLDATFEGTTGPIVLDEVTGTRDPYSAMFEFVNLVDEGGGSVDGDGSAMRFTRSRPYIFRGGEWHRLSDAPLSFNDGTPDAPPDLPDVTVDKKYIGTGMRAAGLVMSGLIMSLSIGFSVWTHVHRKTSKVVRASQPVFLQILCLGIFIMGASIVPLSFDDEIASADGCSIACMTVPWLLCIGFALAFSALFSKTWRINKILHHANNMRRIKVSASDVMKPLLAILAVNILVLSLWTSLAPLTWTRYISAVDVFDRSIESHGACTSNSQYIPYAIVLLVVNLSLLAIALYQIYIAREISTEFAESEYIAKSLASCLLVSFVGIPVMYIVQEERRAFFFVLSSIVFVLCSSLLLFIFVPKVKFHKENNKENLRSIEKCVKKVKKANGSSPLPVSSTVISSASLDSEAGDRKQGVGISIISHPKKVLDLQVQNETLQQEAVELKLRISELENLLQDNQPEAVLEIGEGRSSALEDKT